MPLGYNHRHKGVQFSVDLGQGIDQAHANFSMRPPQTLAAACLVPRSNDWMELSEKVQISKLKLTIMPQAAMVVHCTEA